MMQADSVYERSKKNGGFIAGPRHPLLRRRMEDQDPSMEAEPEPDGQKPPNLRSAASSTESCGSCENYAARKCQMHNGYPVNVSDLCDDFDREDSPQAERMDE